MKTSTLYTYWLAFLSLCSTAKTTGFCVFMRYRGKNTRDWVDQNLRKWSDSLLRLVDVQCSVYNPYGVEPEKGRATIIMCNHTSLYDIPLSFRVFPNHSIRMLAKKELFRIPVMGAGMKAAEFPFIDRKNRHQAMEDLIAARKLMEAGIVLWVAPEGTRSSDGKLASFKKGAFLTAIQAKAIIIPIGIKGAKDILPAHSTHLHLHQKAEIHVGQPIDASAFSLHNRRELMDITHKAMEKLLQ